MRQKTLKIKLFAQMTIGVTRISDSSRCPHNTGGHRDAIPPTENQLVDRDSMRSAGGTTSASSAFSRSERVDPAIRPGVKPVATFTAELLRYLTWRGARPANWRNFRNGLHKIANSPVNTPYPLMRHAL